MNTIKHFGRGFSNCFKAFSVLFEKGLWPFMIIPVVVWLVILALSFYGLNALADYLVTKIKDYVIGESSLDKSWLSFISPKFTGAMGWIFAGAVKLLFWFFGGIFSKYILLMALSPLFALLSERTEEKLVGSHFPFRLGQLIKDIVRGIAISLRNLFLELFFSLLLWLIGFLFPPLFFVTFPLGLIVGWYFTGFALMDYNCERHKMKLIESVRFIKRNRGYAIGIGCVYSLFMSIPTIVGTFLGILIAPAIGVVGATISFLEIRKTNN